MVQKVRQTLFDTISSFHGSLEEENNLEKLIEIQFIALKEAFQIAVDLGEDAQLKVATKILNLYRTGRLGHYTLDSFQKNKM